MRQRMVVIFSLGVFFILGLQSGRMIADLWFEEHAPDCTRKVYAYPQDSDIVYDLFKTDCTEQYPDSVKSRVRCIKKNLINYYEGD